MAKQLYIWLVSQTLSNDYDTFDSFVIVSESAEKAMTYHPRSGRASWGEYDQQEWFTWGTDDMDWDMYMGWPVPQKIQGNVTAILCGEPLSIYPEGKILCASFNAG